MRSLLLLLLIVGSTQATARGPLSNIFSNIGNAIQSVTNQIGQTATNLWNGATNHVNNVIGNVVDSAGNIYGQLVETANGIQFAANFLWDNVFGPAHEMLIEGGQLFLDDKFGNIVSAIGRRSILPENVLSQKYAELTNLLKTNLHKLYDSLFTMQKEALDALQKGEKSIEESIHKFYALIEEVQGKISDFAAETIKELEAYAITIEGEWVQSLQQYTRIINESAKTMSKMFEQLAQSLMGNFVKTALAVVPNAAAIIENLKQKGLLSFLHQ